MHSRFMIPTAMNKLMTSLVLCLGLALAGNAHALTLKIATIAPDGTTWMKEMRAGAQDIEKRTEGRVKIKFFPGGIMGNDTAVLRKMRVGQLHGGAFAGGSLIDFYPDAQIYSLPLLFNDLDEVDYVRARMDHLVKQGLEDAGIVPIGFTEGGFGYLMGQEPIEGVDDLEGLKIWIPEGDLVSELSFKEAGVAPTPLPFPDVYTALQTGLLDTVVTLPTAAIAFQWHTKLKTFTDVPLSYVIGILAISKKSFAKISPQDQAVMRDVMAQAFARLSKLNRQDNQNARDALRNQGITFYAVNKEETRRWRAAADKAIAKLSGQGAYSDKMLALLRKHLADYRQKKGTQ